MVGIHKLSSNFFRKMCDDYGKKTNTKPKLGYEYELLYMSKNYNPIYVLKLDNFQWYEIDDEADLKYAEKNVYIE